MNLISAERNEKEYRLFFGGVFKNQKMTVIIKFHNEYALMLKRDEDDYLEAFGQFASHYIVREETSYPYDVKEQLKTLPIHLPDPQGRDMFKECMNFFIEETSAPIRLTMIEHPGYPLVGITYANNMIEHDNIRKLVFDIMKGIRGCEVLKETIEESEETEEENYDEVDEDVVVEFDVDEEVKQLMKEPHKENIVALEEDDEG